MNVAQITLFFLMVLGQAHATIVRINDLDHMVENSDIIAHVVVGDKSEKVDKDGRPIELSTLEVLEGLKGVKTGQLITLYQLGGSGQQGAFHIAGQSSFRLGEEIVLFGMKYKDMFVTYGVGLGKFRVVRDGEKTKVVEDIADLMAIKRENGKTEIGAPIPRKYPSVEDFKAAIYDALNPKWHLVRTGPKAVKIK